MKSLKFYIFSGYVNLTMKPYERSKGKIADYRTICRNNKFNPRV